MKFNKNSKLMTKKVIEEFVDEMGKTYQKIMVEVQEKELNLGSVKKPKHPEIVHIAYDVPPKEKPKKEGLDFLSGLFD